MGLPLWGKDALCYGRMGVLKYAAPAPNVGVGSVSVLFKEARWLSKKKQSSVKGANRLTQALAFAGLLALPVLAQAKSVICVWDVVGKTGDVYAASTDYALAMQKEWH